MSLRSTLGALLATLLAVAGSTAVADEQAPAIHPTTPYEYWHDYCGYPDVIPNLYEIAGGSLWRMLDSEVMLVRAGQIVPRTDDPNFWRFTQTEPNIISPGSTIPLTGQVPFQGETRLAPNVRSGFLMAPNIVATAPHTNDFNPSDFVVVFNVKAKKDLATQNCILPDPEHIPASDIYLPRAANPLIANTIQYFFNMYGAWTGVDYAAFYLDRPVTGHQYMRIRKNGNISQSDTLALTGHPFGMRTKLQYGIGYAGEKANSSYTNFIYPTFNDFYLLKGMSGGPVYNLDRNYVETVVGSVAGSGCMGFYTDSFTDPTYHIMYDLCDDTPPPAGHGDFPPTHDINQGPIAALAELVPTPYLRVAPLNDVTYVLPINGSPSPTQTVYTATASASETANTAISASIAPTSVPGQPNFVSLSSYNASLAPGASTTITATVTVPTGTACGVYDRYVAVVDNSHGFRDRMLHRFEIGMTDFTVSPDENADIYGITAPSSPANLTYTLTNTRPTAVNVAVSLNQPWLSFETGSSNLVSLAAVGQAGATKTVTIKVNAAAFALANGDYPFAVSFEGQGGCARYAPVQRPGVFHKGVVRLKKTLNALVFPPTPANAPVTDTFTLTSHFCVYDAKLRFNSLTSGSAAGVPLAQWVPSLRVYLDLSGSQTVSSQVWNHNALPPNWNIPSSFDPVDAILTETLLLDRAQNVPPVGASSLSIFNNKDAAGQWSFRLFDDGQGIGTGILDSWELELRGGTNCIGGG